MKSFLHTLLLGLAISAALFTWMMLYVVALTYGGGAGLAGYISLSIGMVMALLFRVGK